MIQQNKNNRSSVTRRQNKMFDFEYRENINYSDYSDDLDKNVYSLDTELNTLSELLKNPLAVKSDQTYQLYSEIRKFCLKDLKTQMMFSKIIADLFEISKTTSIKKFQILMYFVSHSTDSYKTIGDIFGCSKVYIRTVVIQLSKNYNWIKNLIAIKGLEDAKTKKH